MAYTLRCTIKKQGRSPAVYADPDLYGMSASTIEIKRNSQSVDYELEVKNPTPGEAFVIVKIELCTKLPDAKAFLPGFLYNRNRGDALPCLNKEGKTGLFPRLSIEKKGKPYSDSWSVRSDRLSHPVSMLYHNGMAYGISGGPMGENNRFHGFCCRISDSGAAVGYTAGYENSPWLYLDSTHLEEEPLAGPNWACIPSGGSIRIPFTIHTVQCTDERGINTIIREVYQRYHQPPRPHSTMHQVAAGIAGAIYQDAFVEAINLYSTRVFLEQGKVVQEPLGSIAWTGGVEVAAPLLLAAGRFQDERMRQQALKCINHVVQHSLNPASNLPFDAYSDGKWSTKGWWDHWMEQSGHSSYLTGQALFYILSAVQSEERFFQTSHPGWLDFALKILSHIEATKDEEGEVPYLWSVEDGHGIEYDSFGGCWCVAAAASYCSITGDHALLEGCKESMLHYYRRYVCRMECYGTPHDTWKAVDSEGVLAFIKAARILHGITGDPVYLAMLRDGLEYEFTFKFCWNPPIQYDPLKKLGWSSCGGSVTSTCNPHIHPMSNLVTSELDYYAKQSGDAYIASRLADTTGWALQTCSTYDGEYDFGKKGWMSERFCYSQGLLIERYPDGSLCSVWKCFLPWGASNLLEGLCGDIWDEAASMASPTP